MGGAIRDALLGKSVRFDLDLAIRGNGFLIARELADLIGSDAAFVPLDNERGTGRVVVGRGEVVTLDISSFKGEDIAADLHERDFTINAIAVGLDDFLEHGLDRLVDPTGGLDDLRAGIVRACSDHTFRDDPLRILRAFRFQSRLRFRVADDTLGMIPSGLPELSKVSWERIRDEFIAILACDNSAQCIRTMDRFGVIDALFPELVPMKGVDQNPYHHLDVWEHTLETVYQLELLLSDGLAGFGDFAQRIADYANEEPVRDRPRRALLKLAALLHDSGKPARLSVDPDGRVRFFGHEKVSGEICEVILSRLTLASREKELVRELVTGHMRPFVVMAETVTKRSIYRLHRRFKSDVIGLLLLFLADLGATRGPARKEGQTEEALRQVLTALDLFLGMDENPPPPLLKGGDLMRIFGLQPGPILGKMLRKVAEYQGAGLVTTPKEALLMLMGEDPWEDGETSDKTS